MKRAFNWGYNSFLKSRLQSNHRGFRQIVSLASIGMGTGALIFSDPLKNPNPMTPRSFAQMSNFPLHLEEKKGGQVFEQKKSGRLLVQLVREIAQELNLEIKAFSGDWLIILTNPLTKQEKYIWGYSFSLNSQVSALLCNDKSATSDILAEHGLPHIEHRIFLSPASEWGTKNGVFSDLFAYTERYQNNVVLKKKDGTGGANVFHCKNKKEVEAAALKLFSTDYALAVSPFKAIKAEYRIIVLDNQPRLVFRKDRPMLVGDGVKTARTLLAEYLQHEPRSLDMILRTAESPIDFDLETIPAKDEQVPVIWKHNLGVGASASVSIDPELQGSLTTLALKAADALQARFVSVDVVDVDGVLEIIEINSGIMIEKAPDFIPNGYEIAKGIYRDAIKKMFEQSYVPELNTEENKKRNSLKR